MNVSPGSRGGLVNQFGAAAVLLGGGWAGVESVWASVPVCGLEAEPPVPDWLLLLDSGHVECPPLLLECAESGWLWLEWLLLE